MKHITASPRLSRETAKLVRLAIALHASGSQLESQSWELQIGKLVASLFQKKQNETLEQALDYLWTENPPVCDVLAQLVESYAESLVDDVATDAVLIAIPLLVWSRYAIPTGQVSKLRLRELHEHAITHLLASSARLAIADVLFSPDQLPRGFAETRVLLQQLTECAITGQDLHLDSAELISAGEYVADVRYIFAAVVVDKGAPLFRWQQDEITQDEALQSWQLHTKTTFSAMLPGCHYRSLLPQHLNYAAGTAVSSI